MSFRTFCYQSNMRSQILFREMSELDRLNLLDDLMASVQAGHTSASVALNFISEGLRHDESYVVWSAVVNCFGKIKSVIADDEVGSDCDPS